MKIANIIEDGRLAGPQNRIAQVARILNEQNGINNLKCGGKEKRKGIVETIVIFPYSESLSFKRLLKASGIKYIQLPLTRLSRDKKGLLKYIIYFFYEIWLLFSVIKKERFDIVHVSGGSWQFKGIVAGRLSGCKVLWHLNDTKIPKMIRLCFKCIAHFFADGFIVAGKSVKKYYLNQYMIKNKPVFEIQAPVDCNLFDPAEIKQDCIISEKNGLNIVTVGNLNPLKGFEYFLWAARELNKSFSFLNFWIVGPSFDSQKQYMNKLLQIIQKDSLDNCFFYGACNDVSKVLKSADIYLCSSITEASPLSIWEAMAMEKPVVSTDVGDVAQFIHQGYNGFIVSPEDYFAMAEKVAVLVKDKQLRSQFGKRSRQTAHRFLDVKKTARKHQEAYLI